VAQAGDADLVDDSHAPEDFHGARIASLHLRQELRRFLLLDQRAAHAAPAEIDGERKTVRTAADDEHLRVHRAYSALSICAYPGPASTRRRVITRGRALRARTEFPIPQSAANRSSRGKLAGPERPTRTGSPCPFIFAAHTSTGSDSKQNCVTTCRSRPVLRAR